MKNLSDSPIERANILNNKPALRELYEQVGFRGVMFEGKFRYTQLQIAHWFEVDERTIEHYIKQHQEELIQSGYQEFSGVALQQLRAVFEGDTDVARKPDELERLGFRAATHSLGVFTFRTFLNMAMLLPQSAQASTLRAFMLEVVLDFLQQKLGGVTRYVNQREKDVVTSLLRENHYHKNFTDALHSCIEPGKFKYILFKEAIYVSIFEANASEYQPILKLQAEESARYTMYAEVLDLVATYANGFAAFLEKYCAETKQIVTVQEGIALFRQYERITAPAIQQLRDKTSTLMAGRDLAMRDALHLNPRIHAVVGEDFERYLGEKSDVLARRIHENRDVFLRLKDR